MNRNLKAALIGNPNCGKTTVFNLLTGANQRVGNWSGVTVECKTGQFSAEEGTVEVVDLPGIYSLSTTEHASLDEQLTADYVHQLDYDLIINVIDAANLERNLYLTVQLLERGLPVLVVVNRTDILQHQHKSVCCQQLSEALQCKVLPLIASKKQGLVQLKAQLFEYVEKKPLVIPYPEIENTIQTLTHLLEKEPQYSLTQRLFHMRGLALALIEGDQTILNNTQCRVIIEKEIKREYQAQNLEPDILIAQHRYHFIEKLAQKVIQFEKASTWQGAFHSMTDKIDSLVLHRFWGLPIFLMAMYALFFFAINIGGIFQPFFEQTADAIFVNGLAHALMTLHAPSWLISLLAYGVGKGVSTIVTFVPVIGAMFLALAFLEDCGYMARAAFVMDKLMRALGLPGKSFVPLIVGFGCNVPAIMGARVLEHKRERILTVLMSPFMSCGARLAIFTLFVSAFFPSGGQNIVFLLYLIGIMMAILTGVLLKKTLLKGEPAPLVLELPIYQMPYGPALFFHAWHRLKKFVLNAGRYIIPVCILIGALNSVDIQGRIIPADETHQHSVLAKTGELLTPLFYPMGIEQDNWPATVGLFTGVMAKEVVIGTLNSLYEQEDAKDLSLEPFSLTVALKDAVYSIPEKASHVFDGLNPVAASAPDEEMGQQAYGTMVQRFDGQVGAFAYLLFVLLYVPCISAMGAMSKEINRNWTIFSITWTTGIAYGTATIYYQLATIAQHPLSSILWVGAVLSAVWGVYYAFKRLHFKLNGKALPTPIVVV